MLHSFFVLWFDPILRQHRREQRQGVPQTELERLKIAQTIGRRERVERGQVKEGGALAHPIISRIRIR